MQDLAALGIHTFTLDVTIEKSVQSVFQQIAPLSNGRLDYLFNNAGTSCTFPAMDLDISDAEDCFAVNLFGVARVTKIFLPLLIEAKGTVVQTGSLAGVVAFPFASMYSASKAALHAYSNVLRLELKPFGVGVVTMVVGGVLTEIADDRPLPRDSLYLDIDDGVQARRSMAKDNKPMLPEVFAEKVVRQVCLRTTAPSGVIWEGNWAWLMWLATVIVPPFVFDYALARKFKLHKLSEIVASKVKRA